MIKDRIRQIRKSKHLSQPTLGEFLGVSRDMISNIELGRVEPKDWLIKLLCTQFNVNEIWLRTGIGDMYNSLSTKEIAANTMANAIENSNNTFLELISSLSELNSDDLLLFQSFVKMLKSNDNNTKELFAAMLELELNDLLSFKALLEIFQKKK